MAGEKRFRTSMFGFKKSDALCVRKASGYSTLPIIPIATAAVREISHQIVAILLEKVSSFVFLIAINFNKTCGMPKYPRPQESVEIIVNNP